MTVLWYASQAVTLVSTIIKHLRSRHDQNFFGLNLNPRKIWYRQGLTQKFLQQGLRAREGIFPIHVQFFN